MTIDARKTLTAEIVRAIVPLLKSGDPSTAAPSDAMTARAIEVVWTVLQRADVPGDRREAMRRHIASLRSLGAQVEIAHSADVAKQLYAIADALASEVDVYA